MFYREKRGEKMKGCSLFFKKKIEIVTFFSMMMEKGRKKGHQAKTCLFAFGFVNFSLLFFFH